MRIDVRIAVFVTFIVMSASSAAAQNAQLIDQPSGDVWITEPEAQVTSRTGNAQMVPQIPPNGAISDSQNAAPAEFNFNITADAPAEQQTRQSCRPNRSRIEQRSTRAASPLSR